MLLGADAGKYTLTQPTTNADITPATLTPSVLVASKVYDGTMVATITNRSLSGIVGSDDVSLGTSGSAAFADKNAGTGKTVNITLLSLSGSAATNYLLSAATATASADITPLPITVTANPKTKVFGSSDPIFTYQVTSGSLAGGDFFFGSLARVQGENVGAYAIQQYNLAAGGNLDLRATIRSDSASPSSRARLRASKSRWRQLLRQYLRGLPAPSLLSIALPHQAQAAYFVTVTK